MKKRGHFLPAIFLGLVFTVFIIRRWNEPLRKEVFERTPSRLTYTKHAVCRMDCRGIDSGEVREIISRGSINFNQSNRRGRPCPTFAVQGRTASGENVRVILAQCVGETKVVTCYNLEQDPECFCPGDPSTGPGRPAKK